MLRLSHCSRFRFANRLGRHKKPRYFRRSDACCLQRLRGGGVRCCEGTQGALCAELKFELEITSSWR